MSRLISIVTPCYNEEDNLDELINRVEAAVAQLGAGYDYEHIFIDNASRDTTPQRLKDIAAHNKKIKVILNSRNFGHIRSPYYGLLQGSGEAVILMASDLQDPPELIPQLVKDWEAGHKVVMMVKNKSEETAAMFAIRKFYYNLIKQISDVELVKNYTGSGLYDRDVIETLKKIDDPYPYFRGLIADLGYSSTKVYFTQPARKRGITKNNFYTLYDMAMLGITSYSKVPLRLATMLGLATSALSFLVALGYLIWKLLNWEKFQFGLAPLIVSIFFFSSVQLFFIGVIGEYVGFIYTQVLKRPLVVEKERINF